MSWDVALLDAHVNQPLPCERFEDGGTYAVGGTTVCELNVTFNYGTLMANALGFPFRELNGKRAEDVTAALARAVDQLGTERDADYWAPTPGNAGAALQHLLKWAIAHPQGRFEVYG